jgi:hypothetical protein
MRGLTEVFEALTAEYQAWCEREGVPQWSADELLHASYCPESEGGVVLSAEQRAYVNGFIQRWEKAERDERELLR